ncbi:MAG: transposase [Actinobacteria bacterium]|nr:transposase [Actinomycetota bacterium]
MRKPRIEYKGAIYHAYTRGDNREDVFLTDDDRLFYLDTIKASKNLYEFRLLAYCLMKNHTHLIIKTDEAPLSRIMHTLNLRYAKYFNRIYTRIGHLFQGRYKASIIETDAHLLEATRYVHLNPVVVGLVASPDQYPWCSMSAYLDRSPKQPHGLVDRGHVLGLLGMRPSVQVLRYCKYIEEGVIPGKDRKRLMREIVFFRSKTPGI